MIEHIKKFLSRYLVSCKENKYAVLQYIMYGVEFLGKEMRASFTEEILEGANQLLVSQSQLQRMHVSPNMDQRPIEERTLSVQHYQMISFFIAEKLRLYNRDNNKKQWKDSDEIKRLVPRLEAAHSVLDQVTIDCKMGERILLC